MIRFSLQVSALAIAICLSLPVLATAQENHQFSKSIVDIENKYTSVGSIGLTITNFGTIGTRLISWPQQPSCEYPRGSRIEHIYQGGLWVGAIRNGTIHVTTGASDRTARSSTQVEGYEFNSEPDDSITELSTLTDNRPAGSQFSTNAVSHQDFIAEYSDLYTHVPGSGDTIINHEPLRIRVHQESYAWNFPFADFFVILRYTIQNVTTDTLDSVYVGFWNDAVVRNTNLVRPGTPGYYNYTGNGFDSTLRMAYSFDFNGVPGGPPADSYIGLKLLGTTPFPFSVDSLGALKSRTYYNAWQYRISDPNADWYVSPTDDDNVDPRFSRYARMAESMPQSYIDPLRKVPRNVAYLLSTGPFSHLYPDSSLEVVFAVVCAKKYGMSPASYDSLSQRRTLYTNAGWAQRSYDGEIVDGKVIRYQLPKPPHQPIVRADVENQSVVVYWDTSAEASVDPITSRKDFEGYRIYRSNAGTDFLDHEDFILNLSLVGDFDRADDNVGYNTGFRRIRLDSPKMFPGDTVQYWYRFPPKDVSLEHLNGWQYMYGVSAYDQGDSANGVPSLESAKSLHRVVPGTPPVTDKSVSVGVYPNPYYVNAYWDGNRERYRKIYFYNLPTRCQIKVYTLAGDVVTVLDHDASTNNGEGIEWFNQFGDPSTKAQFAGGEHAWDLISRFDQAIATGLYLFTVEDKDSGEVKRGKFLVVK